MATRKLQLAAALVVIAVGAVACGDEADVATAPLQNPASTTTTTQAANESTTTTEPPTNPEPGEVPVSETLEPAGSVSGGTVGRSYLGDDYPQELSGIVGLAATDLAERLGIDATAIAVVLLEEVVWSDGSHGCPKPGMSYTQALTDGLRIILEADGQLYDYRSGGVSDPELCVQAADKDDSRAGVFDLTEEGEIIFIPFPSTDPKGPTEGLNPPDK